jgi:Tfp pilus assembly protein PilF
LVFGLLAAFLVARPWIAAAVVDRWWRQIDADQPEKMLDQIAGAERWLGRHGELEWLRAEVYRRTGDSVRLKKHVDRAMELGMKPERAKMPFWLRMAQEGSMDEPEQHLATMLQRGWRNKWAVYEPFLKGYIGAWRLGDGNRLLSLWREQEPDSPKIDYWEAALKTVDYQIAPATDLFFKAVAKDPSYHQARLKLAELLVEQSKLPEAEEQFRLLVQQRPDDPQVLTGWARCLMNQGKSQEALKALSKLGEATVSEAPLLFLKSQAAFEAGEHQQAAKWLEELCGRWPEVAPYRELQARNFQSLGETAASEKSFAIASASQAKQESINRLIAQLDQDPANLEVRQQLGTMMMYFLSPEAGSAQLLSALRLEVAQPEVHRLLVDYYRRERNIEATLLHQRWLERTQNGMTAPSPTEERSNLHNPIGSGS